jgi:hypothetical protein
MVLFYYLFTMKLSDFYIFLGTFPAMQGSAPLRSFALKKAKDKPLLSGVLLRYSMLSSYCFILKAGNCLQASIAGLKLDSLNLCSTFAKGITAVLSLFQQWKRGKSGQRRAPYFLTGRVLMRKLQNTESATEKIPHRGTGVRVKWRGKSSPALWRHKVQGKPYGLKDQIGPVN